MDQVSPTQLRSQSSSDSMLDRLVERIREATKADLVTLFPYVQNSDLPEQEHFVEPHTSSEMMEPGNIRTAAAQLLLQEGEPIWATDSKQLLKMLGSDLDSENDDFETREQVASTAAIVLHSEEETVGVLFIGYRHSQPFDVAQKNLILGLADLAAIAINNGRRFRDLSQHRLEELEVLRQMDLEVKGSLKLSNVLETILTSAGRIIGVDEASILLYNPNTRQLETAASLGRNRERYEGRSIPLDTEGIVPWVYRHKVPVRVDNVMTDPVWRDLYNRVWDTTVSILDVPLIDGDTVVGVVNFESTREAGFSDADLSFLVTLAAQAVIAINNAQVYERAEAGRRSLQSLHQVTKEIVAQRGDPERVIRSILSQARLLMGAEGALFQQYDDEEPGKYYVDSSDEETRSFLIEGRDLEGSGFKLGILKHVANTKQPHTTIGIDAQDDPFYEGSPGIHSEVAVPLLTEEGTLVGVLAIESPRPFAFDDADERVLVFFGELAGIAIKNARDYSRAINESAHARAESQRFQLLWEAGSELGEITEPLQLESAYHIVIAKIGKFSDGEVVIRRFDAATEELTLVGVGRERATKPASRILKSEGINGQVARELKTISIEDLDHLPPGVALPTSSDPAIKTMVVTPILFERSYYGNLVLSNEKPNSFSDADISLLQGLAKQLAITIHRLEIAKAKQEVEQLNRNLALMGEVGQSAMEIAHRLGNELGLVRTYAKRIQAELETRRVESDSIRDDLDKIVRDVSNVLNMSRGLKNSVVEFGQKDSPLLQLAQSIGETSNLDRARELVPVQMLLEELSFSPFPQNIRIIWNIQEDLPLIRVIPGQITDVLRNLLTNAFEAMPDGGTVTVRASHEKKQSGNRSRYVLIEVIDTGPGIPIGQQAKIFNLFFSTKKSSGFGLWSARQYARANRGDLTFQTRAGAGATFILSLPIDVASEKARA